MLPLLYTPATGYDYALYTRILQLADYLGIEKLVTWIKDKKYLNAIKRDHAFFPGDKPSTSAQDVKTIVYPRWRTEKVYVCPRNIYVHRGDKDKCGAACARAKGDAQDVYEDEFHGDMWKIEEKTDFDHTICWDADG